MLERGGGPGLEPELVIFVCVSNKKLFVLSLPVFTVLQPELTWTE